MRLLEHRAKAVFEAAGIRVPEGRVVETGPSALEAGLEIGLPVAVKALVPVGGRGKAGGVAVVETDQELKEAADSILGSTIDGYPVESVLIEAAVDIEQELYLGVTMDREARRPVVMASGRGGVDIETVAAEDPTAIAREHVDPAFGLHPYQARAAAYGASIPRSAAQKVATVLSSLYSIWADRDATDAEINPLILRPDGELIAADAVLNLDDDALFRQSELAEQAAPASDVLEARATAAGLEYVRLSGHVGVVGNGAGLVMTTLDLIEAAGGSPANFLDVGGGADAKRVAEALSVVFDDPNVGSVLINIFGGITRGDEVAAGINEALAGFDELPVPVVVRLAGTEAEAGRAALTDTVESVVSLEAAVDRAVKLAEVSG